MGWLTSASLANFTWSKNRARLANIYERLVRGIVMKNDINFFIVGESLIFFVGLLPCTPPMRN